MENNRKMWKTCWGNLPIFRKFSLCLFKECKSPDERWAVSAAIGKVMGMDRNEEQTASSANKKQHNRFHKEVLGAEEEFKNSYQKDISVLY